MGLKHLPCHFLFLILIISFTLISGSHDVHLKCRDDQKSKLIQLKHDLTLDASISTRLALWNTSMDCCSWEGITCNSGRVIGLDLSNEGIYGGINSSSSLFDLLFIESLNLAYNNFNDVEIPHGFDKLANMTYLNLSNSGFSGQIPTGISSLKQLVTLDISSITYTIYYGYVISSLVPQLKLESPSLRTLIQNLSKLEELYLDGVIIKADGYEWCQALSTSVPNLRVLSLSNCNLSGPIDSSLARLVSLSVIRLDVNNLSTTVPKFFSNFTNLTTLSFQNSSLRGSFPTKILLLPKLQMLYLSNNVLLEGSFPETFSPDNSLHTVVLGHTKFSGKISDSIHNLKQLSKLDLYRCNLSGDIPSSMEKLKQLVHLEFSFNMFTGHIPSLHLSKNLSFIKFSSNHLTGQIQSLQWESFSKLVDLDLSGNSLTGSIPLSLFSLPLLQNIQLSNNQFSGQLNEFSTASSGQLWMLDLSANKIEGPIPISIFELNGLGTLKLSHNRFNGTVDPNMIKYLKDITYLDISFNKLSLNISGNNFIFSTLPWLTILKLASCDLEEFPNLQNQSSLIELDISSNKIRGEIPRWLFKLGNASLRRLNLSYNNLVSFEKPLPYISQSQMIIDLHSNLLQGEIPILTSSASVLDYSSNNFSSFIPDENGYNLTYTRFLSLSNNSLTGPIPKSICNSLYLEVVDLSFNDLNGTIPPCLLQMDRIRVLNLGSNKLTGTIPDTSPATCSLRTFDINDNQIHGLLPRTLENCNNLEVLNVGNNQITDTFPLWFGNFSTLRVLVMRSNKFHGPIHCQGSFNNLTLLQIVDLASNKFSGYISDQCFLSWTAMMHNVGESQPVANHLSFAYSGRYYYQDTVTLTFKGSQMELVKILTVFTTVDFSNNNFEGDIPEMIGELKSLYGLNLSKNAFTGHIPTSLANLVRLGSLDLSHNKLIGNIPIGLLRLTFLAVFNISFNNLTGKIPVGSQFNTFTNTSYLGNEGLCGEPLSKHCSNNPTPPPEGTKEDGNSNFGTDIISEYLISAVIGFVFGLGIVIWPLVFWKRWRDLYYSFFDGILLKISILQNRIKHDRSRRARRRNL